MRQITFTFPRHAAGFHIVTREVINALGALPENGLLHLFIQHTSAALAIGENADPTVRQDLRDAFDRLAPKTGITRTMPEGPDDMPAHLKSALLGTSISIPITEGKLNLGTWQGHISLRVSHARDSPHARRDDYLGET